MSHTDMNKMFKDETFIDNYKIAEKATGVFGEAMIEQSSIVSEANSNPEKPLVIFDNACGTGIVAKMLNEKIDAQAKNNWKLTCGDLSEGMVEYSRREGQAGGWPNAEFKVVDAQDNKLPSDHFTHVFTAFAFMAMPKSLVALDDTIRIIKPGGTIGFTTWVDVAWVYIATKAMATIPGDNYPWPTGDQLLKFTTDGQWNSPSWVESQLQERGFLDIKVNAVKKSFSMKVPEFTQMLKMMIPMVTKFFWTEEQREKGLPLAQPALEKYAAETYGPDGEIPGEWIAVVATARKA